MCVMLVIMIQIEINDNRVWLFYAFENLYTN